MSVFTTTEVLEIITDLKNQIKASHAKPEEYSLNTSQSTQRVKNRSLKMLREELEYWQGIYEDCLKEENGSGLVPGDTSFNEDC